MATTSLNDVLEEVGALTQPDWVSGTSDAGASTTLLTSASLLKTGGTQGTLWSDGWIVLKARTSPNRIRGVDSVDQTTGAATLSAAVNSVVTAEAFQGWSKWNPLHVQQQAIAAQKEMWALTDYTLAGADLGDNLRQVNLTSLLPWLVSAGQVEAARLRSGSTANTYSRRQVQGWSPLRDVQAAGGIVTLDLALETFPSSDALQLRLWRDYNSLSPLSEVLASAAPLRLLAWWTIYRMCLLPDYEDKDLLARAVAEINDLNGVDSGPQSYPLFYNATTIWGP